MDYRSVKLVTIGEFLTEQQLQRAIELFEAYREKAPLHGFAQQLATEVIEPSLEDINRKLGQENDPMFLAYMVEYALRKTVLQ